MRALRRRLDEDGRLTLANVRGAADRGAVSSTTRRSSRSGATAPRSLSTADPARARARRSSTRRARGSTVAPARGSVGAPSIRLSKGVHVLVDGGADWEAALTIPHDKVRVSFAVPWEGMLLLGTTDTLSRAGPRTLGRPTTTSRRCRRGEGRREGLGAVRAIVLRAARAPGGGGRPQRPARDRLHDRGPGDAERGRRQADDLPPHRARRARAPRREEPRPPAAPPAGGDGAGRFSGGWPYQAIGTP